MHGRQCWVYNPWHLFSVTLEGPPEEVIMSHMYVFEPTPRPSLPMTGSDAEYAVERIFCVGRNYAAHAREMGANPENEDPLFFRKSATTLTRSGASIPYPPATGNYHHEVELVVAMGSTCFDVSPHEALSKVYAYGVGLDMTRRDLQAAAKKRAAPWGLAKNFENAAVVSPLTSVEALGGHPSKGAITLSVNGEMRQEADLSELIWTVDQVISRLSAYHTLGPGDLIFTGTPSGVGPVLPGDYLKGTVEGVGTVEFEVSPAR